MKRILTIAGSDSSGGAGIQADIKTITMHGMYAMTAITAITAQNTKGVSAVWETPKELLREQIRCVIEDIRPDGIKIGMVAGKEQIRVIAEELRRSGVEPVVVDTVMVSTSGRRLLEAGAETALCKELLPLARLVTPNIPEAQVLTGIQIHSPRQMEQAAQAIHERIGAAVLIKGGHLDGEAADLLFDEERMIWFSHPRVENRNTHGTGCTLSSAIACRLALGESMEESVRKAKAYLTGAIRAKLDLGAGRGPLNHMWAYEEEELLRKVCRKES